MYDVHVAKCLAEKNIHSLKSVWQPFPPFATDFFVFVRLLSAPPWPLSTHCLQSADVRPGCFSPGSSNKVCDMDGAGNTKEEMSEATEDFEI